MGKREESKKYYYAVIQEAAKELFTTQGFDNTTMEQIASKASVGLGTAYNYFKSKEELYILTMAEGTTGSIKNSLIDIDMKNGSAADIVTDVILKQIIKLNKIHKGVWKATLPIIFSSLKSNNKTFKKVLESDFQVMETLCNLIEELKQKNKVPYDFDTNIAVNLIFGALFLHLAMYIYTDDVSFDDVCKKIKADISFIFKNSTQQGELA